MQRSSTMSTQENKTLVRRFLQDVIESQDLRLADTVQSADYTLHMPGLPGPVRGLDTWKGIITSYFVAFPDMRVTLEDDLAEDDRVAIRYTWTGTQRGPFMGIPATGRLVRVPGTAFFRVANGRIAEEWHLDDVLGLLQQLGAIPAPGQAVGVTG
jgi:steroid delta-isomerase-like uncharacterized protein